MEKFTRFEDKSCGINPFVLQPRRGGGAAAVAGMLLAPVRLLVLATVVAPALALALALQAAAPVAPLRSLLRLALARPLARLALLLLGFWSLQESVPSPQRLRFGHLSPAGSSASERARRAFGATVQAGDVILVNHSSLVDVLYLFAR
eukprot:CAMPEP_0202074382 /NCGR_PEP_ID=MMETSP0964-20121228/3581_1 /ASSEMBLY_ACC=CAM_ASM_000500 /TAXON_ID=4773 /ORGANISM="Schizochytrium aggregatum, Strain ATCC28209" /LENGTH=147 /DNA_ID=CAMNT_0048641527 /DNA_START=43 /DNA_END=482 /DNA_ORIENTATION=+